MPSPWSPWEALALLLLTLPFLASGVAKARDPRAAAAEVAALGLPAPALPAPALLARATAALQLLAPPALLLSAALAPLAAVALAAFTLAATLLAHAFWRRAPGDPARPRDATAFWEHLGLVGALLFAALVAGSR